MSSGKRVFFNSEGPLPASLAMLFWLIGVPFGKSFAVVLLQAPKRCAVQIPRAYTLGLIDVILCAGGLGDNSPHYVSGLQAKPSADRQIRKSTIAL